MKVWQNIWIKSVIIGCIIHTLRDIQQYIGITTILSTSFVKPHEVASQSILWSEWNTVIIEFILFLLSLYILRRNKFGKIGWFTVVIVICTLAGFVYYYVLL